MNPEQAIEHIAERLWQAQCSRQPIAPVRAEVEAATAAGHSVLDTAYRVQQGLTRRRLEGGDRLVGRKIGLTSKAVQAQLGVDSPDFGALFASMAAGDGEEIDWARTLQPKVEVEIALVLARELPRPDQTLADLISATAYALPAIEVVGSRIARWDIALADTVADNASSGLFVLGTRPVPLSRLDLVSCGMVMSRGGEPVSVGTGAACLGNPLNAALWLANTLARRGQPLRAGDLLLSGALGPMVAVRPGDAFEASIEGLGYVRACFGREQRA